MITVKIYNDILTAEQKENLKQAAEWAGDRGFYGSAVARKAFNSDWVAEMYDGDELVGVANVSCDGVTHPYHIDNLATKRAGYGTQLLKALCDHGWNEVDVIVSLTAHEHLREYYEARGFELDDCYYGDEHSGAIYWYRGA